jgi:hypothetical protein
MRFGTDIALESVEEREYSRIKLVPGSEVWTPIDAPVDQFRSWEF